MSKLKFSNRFSMLLLSILLVSGFHLNGQSLKIDPKTFKMTISGTTNVHDFTSKVTQVAGEIVLNGPKQVQSLNVTIPVKSIKSGEKLMDSKTYATFNADKHPNINFKLTEVSSLNVNGDKIDVTLTGNLTMAGVTRKVELKSTGVNNKSGAYAFKGSISLKMSDFKMKPPTAMMGVMKVGDNITLKYDATFSGEQLTSN